MFNFQLKSPLRGKCNFNFIHNFFLNVMHGSITGKLRPSKKNYFWPRKAFPVWMWLWPQRLCTDSFFFAILFGSSNFPNFWCRNYTNFTYPDFNPHNKTTIYSFNFLLFYLNSSARTFPRMKTRSTWMRSLGV